MTTFANDDHAEFCKRVKTRRQKLGLSQVEMASRLGVHQVQWTQFETGRKEPTLTQMHAIAVALGVSLNDLLPQPKKRFSLLGWLKKRFHI